MDHKTLVFIISLLQACQGATDRDLLLTPKEGLQILGRTVFYDPQTNETNGMTPWEQTLKHVTYLTLFMENGSDSNIKDLKEYRKFMQSPYIRIHEDYPRFGDIITMAQGRLENSNGYHFVEGICEQYCNENILALWRVQKIRHRDSQRGFRYEMKFSVTPLSSKDPKQIKHTLNEQYFKSFIMKDDDYPESFQTVSRRSDSVENFSSNERRARIINEIPRKENTFLAHLPPLNIGEYFKEVPKAASKVGYLSSTRPVFPTTYRPNYHVKFTKPGVLETEEEPKTNYKPNYHVKFTKPEVLETEEEPKTNYRPNYHVKFTKPEVLETEEEPKTVVTHHFHHHYFMQDTETSLEHEQHLFHGKPDVIRIIEGPNAELLSPQYTIKVQPASYTTTTAAPSPPAVFYMQQIPMYIQSFPQEETTSRQIDTKHFKQNQLEEISFKQHDQQLEEIPLSNGSPFKPHDEKPFKQSEQEIEEIRYSDPDPLYETSDSPSESAAIEIHPQVERPSSQIPTKPDSISALLPPPTEDQDTRVPYIDDEEGSTTNQPRTSASTRQTLLPKKKFFISTSTSESPLKHASKLSLHRIRNYPHTTTEQPVLKWKPKRKPKEIISSSERPDSSAIPSSTEEKVITVTPSKMSTPELEILTQKSVSKSISVRVGNRSEEVPLATETTTTGSSEKPDSSGDMSDENESKP